MYNFVADMTVFESKNRLVTFQTVSKYSHGIAKGWSQIFYLGRLEDISRNLKKAFTHPPHLLKKEKHRDLSSTATKFLSLQHVIFLMFTYNRKIPLLRKL